MKYWRRVKKTHPRAVAYADRHYTRQTPGSPQFMPPGQTIVLLSEQAVFGWWRPKPGIEAMHHLDGWTCTIFHREGKDGPLASELILDAEDAISLYGYDCGGDGLLTYIGKHLDGTCFQLAGYAPVGSSVDGKALLGKPYRRWLYPDPLQGVLL